MIKSTLDTFMELFEGALDNPDGRTAFINFLRQLNQEERADLMAVTKRYGLAAEGQFAAITSILAGDDKDSNNLVN